MKKIRSYILGILLFSLVVFAGNAYYVLTQSDIEKLDSVNQKISSVFAKKDEAFKTKVISFLQTKKEQTKSERNKAYIDYILQAHDKPGFIPNTNSGVIIPEVNTEMQTGAVLPNENQDEEIDPVENNEPVITFKALSDFPELTVNFEEGKFEVYEGDEISMKVFLNQEAPDNISIPYTLKGNITENEFYNFKGEIHFLKGEKEATVSFIPLVDCELDTNSIYIALDGVSVNSSKITIKDTDEKNTDITVSQSPYHTGSLLISGPKQKHLFFHTWSGGKYTIYYDKQECSGVTTVGGMATGTSNEIECTPVSKNSYDGTRPITIRYETGINGVCFWKK